MGDAERGAALLDLICDEMGVGYEPVSGGGRFYFNAADRTDAKARLEDLLDRKADDWRDHLRF